MNVLARSIVFKHVVGISAEYHGAGEALFGLACPWWKFRPDLRRKINEQESVPIFF